MFDLRFYNLFSGFFFARFPWESAFSGREAIQPCCPLIAKYQIHVTADISFALRNYLSMTHDLNWFQKEGCELSREISRFWASRAAYNSNIKRYEINEVMGPDEDHANISNNVYTNIAAGYSLYFGQ